MKAPRIFCDSLQTCANVGINPFAAKLLAESFADKPERFGDENVVLVAPAHNGQNVWIILSKTQPTAADFEEEDTSAKH